MRFLGALLVVGSALLIVRDARADDADAARRQFVDGVHLLQLGDYEGARRLFKKADADHHAPPIVYNLGLAEERLGHVQAAVDAYESYVAEMGEGGDLSAAATTAIAQLKARSTRLRIATAPAGARIFIDGAALVESSPTMWLVPAGHHVIVAQGNGWRGEQDVEVRGAGDVLEVVVKGTSTDALSVGGPGSGVGAPSSTASLQPVDVTEPRPAESGAPDGLVWGAAFALVPFTLIGAPNTDGGNGEGATQIAAGGILEIGYAITDRFELLARGLVALGPDGKPTNATMGGPGISFRVGSHLWLGASFIGGQLATEARDAHFHTDFAFGTLLEATYAVITTKAGQWSVGFQPGLLLTQEGYENTAILFPFSFGFRAY